MDKYIVLLYFKKEKEESVSKLYCSSLSVAEFYMRMFGAREEIVAICLVSLEEKKASLEKGGSINYFLEWLNDNALGWVGVS